MTMPHKTYVAQQNLSVSTLLNKYINPMEENSPTNLENTLESTTMPENGSPTSQNQQASKTNEVIDIEEEDKPLPPSLHCTITEETLCDDDCSFVFWAMLCIPIPEKPVDLVVTMFKHLESFITNMLEAKCTLDGVYTQLE